MHPMVLIYAVVVLLAARVIFFLFQSITSPLRHIPGPFIARFSRLWYLKRVYEGDFHHENIALHKRYGSVVRLAPDLYSIDNPDKGVYGVSSKFPKSDWYDGWEHPASKGRSLFTDRSIKRHSEERRKFSNLYSMSALVSYEGYVDDCTEIFVQRLKEFAASGQTIDMGHWFQCYAFDVIGDITYSERFGFLDKGEDVSRMMAALQRSMTYSTCAGIYASWHPYMFALMARLSGSGAAGREYLMKFATGKIAARKEQRSTSKSGEAALHSEKVEDVEEGAPRDFLDKILDAKDENPEKITDYNVFIMNMSNIIAGSDTTAVSLSSVLYHLLKYPETIKKLREEIKDFEDQGECDEKIVRFSQSQKMPYLQAVIKEALRLHPATGLPLWRVVPEGGAEICGQFFPAGTTVGLNGWVAHFNTDVFGADAEKFKPERWIDAENEGGERLKTMEAYYLPFGLGSRTCIGRHISILEMAKLIPKLVKTFDFQLQEPDKEWKTENHWFVKPVGFNIMVKDRSAGGQ